MKDETLVQRYIGTSYDVVKFVYDNFDDVMFIQNNYHTIEAIEIAFANRATDLPTYMDRYDAFEENTGFWRDASTAYAEFTRNLTVKKDTDQNDYGAALIPVGTTAQRPAVPAQGMYRFDSDVLHMQWYDGTNWIDGEQNLIDAVAHVNAQIGDVTVDGTAGNTITDRIATAIANLVDGAPDLLDTLNELAAAIGDDENFITTVNTTISTGDSTTLTSANTYTDTRETAITTAYQTYADQAEADANTYTDTQIGSSSTTLTTQLQTYADQAEVDAVTTANTYTDTRETAITTAYQTYADTAESDAVTTAAADATTKANTAETNAKTYTDTLIGDVTVDGTADNTLTDRINSAAIAAVTQATTDAATYTDTAISSIEHIADRLGVVTTVERDALVASTANLIFNSDTQKVQIYVNDTGLAAGGASNATAGWIDMY